MSVWFLSSRPTVASVSPESVVRLMIARRVQVMWSSQSRRISWRSEFAPRGAQLVVGGRRVRRRMLVAVAVRGGVVTAGDGKGDEGAEEGDQHRQRQWDGTVGAGVHVSVPFGCGRVAAIRGRQSRLAATSRPAASIALVATARPSTGSGCGWRTGRPVVIA